MSSEPEVKGKQYGAGHGLSWRELPRVSQLYVTLVILAVTAQQAEVIRYGQTMANPLITLSLVLRYRAGTARRRARRSR